MVEKERGRVLVSEGRVRLVRIGVTRYERWSLGTNGGHLVRTTPRIVQSLWKSNEGGYWSVKDE